MLHHGPTGMAFQCTVGLCILHCTDKDSFKSIKIVPGSKKNKTLAIPSLYYATNYETEFVFVSD